MQLLGRRAGILVPAKHRSETSDALLAKRASPGKSGKRKAKSGCGYSRYSLKTHHAHIHTLHAQAHTHTHTC